jgi:hypothetical protein
MNTRAEPSSSKLGTTSGDDDADPLPVERLRALFRAWSGANQICVDGGDKRALRSVTRQFEQYVRKEWHDAVVANHAKVCKRIVREHVTQRAVTSTK